MKRYPLTIAQSEGDIDLAKVMADVAAVPPTQDPCPHEGIPDSAPFLQGLCSDLESCFGKAS